MINVDPRVPAYDLVDKYIRLTAPRLVVYPCPREHNPFIELLFPVAFSHVVAMNSILALAAAHSGSPHSRFLYGAALADLRSALQQDSIGTEVLVATMMLVFFETAEGHSKRQAIQHLQGLARLLKFRRQRGAQTLHDGLAMEVLIYHVVTISIYDNLSQTILKGLRISPTGPTVWSNIGGDLRQSYCLSGLSSEVLDFILEITGLFSPSPEAHTPLPAMLIVEGIALADKINQWQPAIAGDSLFPYALDATNHAELTLAAVLWKNAAFLNLLSLMHGKKISPDDARIAEVVKGSMITLQQIPEHSSVETCLNWPLVMIGSFAISQQDRSLLRRRFNSMEWLIFKNVYIAISILEEAWAQFDEYGTVNLETVMQIPPFDVILS
ncbi:hypothetical protein A1O3_01704 [Capronia epimyces CBS 606.96]|uniref:Uncharacterized protein n=1 Tax=Capronia epimyces CBS 606.96 TaxID=1182542 RepID=W9YJR4_9EURO|nr:uncharacterized protein A1O3_01704 [Capronia epimyces CBS 606.96]EXJ93147.1 hypothetical protein A1O3_01704 [Capronia epimyces CBS 606.96]